MWRCPLLPCRWGHCWPWQTFLSLQLYLLPKRLLQCHGRIENFIVPGSVWTKGQSVPFTFTTCYLLESLCIYKKLLDWEQGWLVLGCDISQRRPAEHTQTVHTSKPWAWSQGVAILGGSCPGETQVWIFFYSSWVSNLQTGEWQSSRCRRHKLLLLWP